MTELDLVCDKNCQWQICLISFFGWDPTIGYSNFDVCFGQAESLQIVLTIEFSKWPIRFSKCLSEFKKNASKWTVHNWPILRAQLRLFWARNVIAVWFLRNRVPCKLGVRCTYAALQTWMLAYEESWLICLCWGFTAQSTQWGHGECGQFLKWTLPFLNLDLSTAMMQTGVLV